MQKRNPDDYALMSVRFISPWFGSVPNISLSKYYKIIDESRFVSEETKMLLKYKYCEHMSEVLQLHVSQSDLI